MSAINVYTLGKDLLALLSTIEDQYKIKYVKAGRIGGPITEEFEAFGVIPDLGRATGKRARGSGRYLIVEKNYNIHVQTMKMFDGDLRFDVEQSFNPDSTLFCPGGEWKDRTIIGGDFSTISDSLVSLRLFRGVRSAVRKDFTNIKQYWLGPEALIAFRDGWRLTHAADTSPDYDLREE
jgi:hypothetical protein